MTHSATPPSFPWLEKGKGGLKITLRILSKWTEEKKEQGEGIIKMINESWVCCFYRLCCFFLKGSEGGGDVPFPVRETIISYRTFAVLGKNGPDCAAAWRLKWQSEGSRWNDNNFVVKQNTICCFLRTCRRLNKRCQGVCLHKNDWWAK